MFLVVFYYYNYSQAAHDRYQVGIWLYIHINIVKINNHINANHSGSSSHRV